MEDEHTTSMLPEGPIAHALGERFELRPQQTEMAREVTTALKNRSVLVIEAGTGVGKSFAYLAPAIRRIIESGGRERVVVATNTIALQEQLVNKDLPMLLGAMGQTGEDAIVRPELVKGRGNYVSLRRLELASKRQDRLFSEAAARRSLHMIEDWAYETSDGSLATLPPIERPGIWDRVQSDSGNCMGRRCPTYGKCFYQNARRRMERANLLITNHALFFSDLALRAQDAGFLPTCDHVIFDEAHQIEDVASDHFGLSLAEGRVRHLLSALHQGRKRKGFLATMRIHDDEVSLVDRAMEICQRAASAADGFFSSLVEHSGGVVGSARVGSEEVLENCLTAAFRELALSLKRLREAKVADEDKLELNAFVQRAMAIADDAQTLTEQSLPGCVYWIEMSASDTFGIRATLACSPVEVAPVLKAQLFTEGRTVVLTSATLAGAGGSFNHLVGRLGCLEAKTVQLGSPFDHALQVELHVEDGLPDPRSERHADSLGEAIERHVRATEGGAFVLFTSFKSMHATAERVRQQLEEDGYRVVVQGRDGSRSAILEVFRSDDRAVLFGTNSFWQGVDVPGRGLRNVIITRLPFEPPDRPLTQARLERIKERGGDPFREDSLPRAVIRFRQGFGRLIRSSADEGRVVVLDPRLVRSGYGRAFLSALPEGIRVYRDGELVASEG